MKVQYNLRIMPQFFGNLLRALRERRGTDMSFMCRHLLSERGEASQTALAQEIIVAYKAMNDEQRLKFFEMLSRDFEPDRATIVRAAADYQSAPGPKTLAALSAAVESPRQELFRRINTAPRGTETLVTLREHVLAANKKNFAALDLDLKHLFRSWFNRGFLRLERISWHTSALILEKLIAYESVHEINGWPDLHRRLEADRRCFAFFHPALVEEPIIFVEVALSKGLTGDLEPLLGIQSPVLPPNTVDAAIFYSINNCLRGLRGVPFGNFLIKQVVAELAAEFPIFKFTALSRRYPTSRRPCGISKMKRALPTTACCACWPITPAISLPRHAGAIRSRRCSICWKNPSSIETFWPSLLSASLSPISLRRARMANSTIPSPLSTFQTERASRESTLSETSGHTACKPPSE